MTQPNPPQCSGLVVLKGHWASCPDAPRWRFIGTHATMRLGHLVCDTHKALVRDAKPGDWEALP